MLRMKGFEVDWKGYDRSSYIGDVLGSERDRNKGIVK